MYADVLTAIEQGHVFFAPLALKGIVVKSYWDGDCSLSSSRMQHLHNEAVCFQDTCPKHRAKDDKYCHYESIKEEETEENSLNIQYRPDFYNLKLVFTLQMQGQLCDEWSLVHLSFSLWNFFLLYESESVFIIHWFLNLSYSTLNIRLHSSTPLYVLHYLDFHRCELCSWGEEEGSGYVSQTGLWLPVSKFRAGPFCMSKLESTPSICRLLIMLRHHLLSFVSSSRRTVAPTKCWHELSTHKSKEGYTGSSGEDWH